MPFHIIPLSVDERINIKAQTAVKQEGKFVQEKQSVVTGEHPNLHRQISDFGY
jgi:hypothetical protein